MRITYQPWGESLAELTDAARRAEQAGAEVVWVSEMHRSALGSAAALAAGTERVGIGTAVALAFPRSPMITALEALDVDEMSDGRLLLGLGTGVARLNQDWHNVTFGKPVPHMRETIRNIRHFWEHSHTGADMQLDGEWEPMAIRGYERPYEPLRTHIPIYLAAVGPAMTRLAGRVGDGWISHELCSPSYLGQRILPELHAGLTAADRDRADLDVVVSAVCSIDPDPGVARARAAGVVGFYASVKTYADFFEFHGLGTDQQAVIEAFRSGGRASDLASSVSEAMVDAVTLTGDRDRVAARLQEYRGLADSVKLSPPSHGVTNQDSRAVQDQILAMIPELKEQIA